MRVLFTPEAKRKLELYVRLCDIEVSGLGRVHCLGREEFLIDEIVLLEQESTWGSTELSRDALTRFLEELLARGEDPAAYRVFWHSHVDMRCFWSRVDERTIKNFGAPWLISIVAKQFGEILARIDVFDPVHLCADKVTVDVYLKASDDEVRAIKGELEHKVKRKAFSGYERYHHKGWWSDWWEVDNDEEI